MVFMAIDKVLIAGALGKVAKGASDHYKEKTGKDPLEAAGAALEEGVYRAGKSAISGGKKMVSSTKKAISKNNNNKKKH